MTRDVPQRRGGVVRDVPRMVRGDCGSSARVAPPRPASTRITILTPSLSRRERMVVYKPGIRPAGLQTRYRVQLQGLSRKSFLDFAHIEWLNLKKGRGFRRRRPRFARTILDVDRHREIVFAVCGGTV